MLGKAPTYLRLASFALAVGVVFATPLAGAFGMGVDAASVNDMKDAGATPQYGQTWVGRWMKTYGWSGFESDLRTMRDAGVTPVIQWYYYGDSISPNCVQYGCDGRTKSEWDAMAKELATRAKAIMGSRAYFVVMEPEFQKNGIEDWETFDGYLENQARILKANGGSGGKVVVGFGHWGNWDRFDRAVAASHYTGFQVLRGSTRDPSSTAIDSADYMIGLARQLKDDWGKPIIVFDFGIATYGGWEWVQEKALDEVIAKRSQLDAVGIKAIVWRYVNDNDHSSGYFGPAESTWGVKTSWGGKKAGYDELVTLIKGSSSSTSTTSASSTPTSGSVFSGVQGNEWWIQAKVANSPRKVEASVDGGSWVSLTYRSWGAWAVSTRAPTGSTVTLRATYGDGSTQTASYLWPSATPTSGGGSSGAETTSTATFDASFRLVKLEEWWTQVDVDSGQTITKVDARVNGGSWIPLERKSWGDWAASFRVPSGSRVEFRATASNGATDLSSGYTR